MKIQSKARLFVVLLVTLLPALAQTANLTWDANTSLTGAQDGSGVWDNSNTNWWTGSANAVWNGVTPDVANFGGGSGIAGTVTLGANVVASNLNFNAATMGYYTIAGGGFQLGMTNRTITPNINATISASIVGGSLSVANSGGILTLSGNNATTNFNLGANAGSSTAAVRVNSSTALGVASGTINIAGGQGNLTSQRIELTSKSLNISNSIPGGLGRNLPAAVIVNLATDNIWSGRLTRSTGGADVALQSEMPNGITFDGSNGGGVALSSQAGAPRNFVLRGSGGGTISGVISNGSGVNNAGLVKYGSGTWTLSGANTFTNGAIVNEGILRLDYSAQDNSKLPDQGPLTLAGGTVNLSSGTHTETVFSTVVGAGSSSITRGSGSATLRMNTISRNRGGTLNFDAASIADTDTLNVNGILGGYATIGGTDWAMNSTGAADGSVTTYSGYTDIGATGSTIADAATANVRLNSAGGGGNIALGAATTTINTLLQNTTTPAAVDTSSATLRLGVTGGVLIPTAAQSLALGTTPNSGVLTAGGADNTGGEIILINHSANTLTVNSTVTDNGAGIVSLTKAGSGIATLNGNNSHSGTNSIVGGTLNVSSEANLGTGAILIHGGTLNATADFNLSRGITLGPTSRYGNGTIGVDSSRTLTIDGIISNSDGTGNSPGGSLTKIGAGTLVLNGVNTYALGTIINAGTVSISTSGNLGPTPGAYIPDHIVLNGGTLAAAATLTLGAPRGIMLGPINGAGTGTVEVNDGATLQLDGRIADNWNCRGAFTKSGNGLLVLTSVLNDYSGNTTISAGTLQLNNGRAIPNGGGKGNLINNGVLALNGVTFAANGISGSGSLDSIGGGASTFIVGGLNNSDSINWSITQNGGGPLALSKIGSGTFTYSGTSFHSGSTLVNAGTLALSGPAAIGSTTNIAVSSGATFNVSGISGGTFTLGFGQVLSGNGNVLGTIDAGSGTIAPGTSVGTLNLQNLTLNGSSLNYELANITTTGAGVNDFVVVSGALNITGPTTLNLTYLNGIPAASGKYTLFSYGSFSGDVNNISVPSGFTILNNTVSKTIELLINHVPTNLVWVGDGSGNVWDINTTPNWSGGAVFFNGDTANFDNTGSASPAIYIAVPVIAAAVNVSGSQTYDFTGNTLSSANLNKSGSGTLIVENDSTFAAGTTISSGTVQIGNAGSTGTLTGGNITNNGALVVNRFGDVVLNSAISGSGSVSQINVSGTTALSGSNSYSGNTLVTAGRLYARNTFAFGLETGGTTVSPDAQIYMDQNINFGVEPLTLNGNGLNGAGDGALRKGGAGVTTFGGPITLGSDTTINLDGNATLNLTNASGITGASANLTLNGGGGSVGSVSGPINLSGGAGVLTKAGAGSWILAGSNSMSLATITDGNLTLAHSNALGTNLNVVLSSLTGGPGLSGTRLTLSGGLSIPANRTLTMPSSGAGAIRSAFFGTGAGVTNTWTGPITLFGDGDPLNNLGFGVDANSTLVISGNVTADSSFAGKLLMRGNAAGLGIITGTIGLNPSSGQIQTDDGSTWVFTSPANTWLTTIFAGSSMIRLGVNNALPNGTLLTVGNGAANRLDLAGFNQQVAGMEIGVGLAITNSSSVADSTLTYSSGSLSIYGGTISDGTRKLNLTLAGNSTLYLTNPASLNLGKSVLSVSSGSALQLDYTGTNTVNALVLNGVSQSAGVYNSINAAPYLAGTGNLLVAPGPSAPVTLTNSVSGNVLSFSWPAGQGWRLQTQTNSINTGISNNWVYVTDGSVSSTNITINPANPTVFFRLTYP